MSYDDFCGLTPEQFAQTCEAWNEARENNRREGWERARMAAAIIVQPHCKKALKPTDIIHFPWDERHEERVPRMTKEEQLKRMEELRKEWGEGERANNAKGI